MKCFIVFEQASNQKEIYLTFMIVKVLVMCKNTITLVIFGIPTTVFETLL